MPKNTDIQAHWTDAPLPAEKAQSNGVAQKKNHYHEKKLKKSSNITIFKGTVFENLP